MKKHGKRLIRTFAAILAAVLCLSSLSGCGLIGFTIGGIRSLDKIREIVNGGISTDELYKGLDRILDIIDPDGKLGRDDLIGPDAPNPEKLLPEHNSSPSVYYTSDEEHVNISLDEVPRDSFNKDELDRAIDELYKKIKSKGNDKRIRELVDEIIILYDKYATDAAICDYDYYKDVTDTEAAERNRELTEMGLEVGDNINLVFKAAFESDYYDLMCEIIEDDPESYLEYEALTDEEQEAVLKREDLKKDYYSLMDEQPDEYSAEWPEWAEKVKKKYKELIELNNSFAKLEDYDNYLDYAYNEVYLRDYTKEDVEVLSNKVQDKLLMPYAEFYSYKLLKSNYMLFYNGGAMSADERIALVRPYMKMVNGELSDVFDYFADNRLYDMDEGTNKADVGYTTPLYSYGSAYIFDSPYGFYQDLFTLIHEFGHFANAYADDVHAYYDVNNMDVAEIQSQGLELMFYDLFPLMLGNETGEVLQTVMIADMLNNILIAFAVNEFEAYAYTHPDATIKELDTIANRTGEKYYSTGFNEDTWFTISHLYESPFYYVSYGTSALAALEILDEFKKDGQRGLDIYMQISASSSTEPFVEVLDKVGLEDIFNGEGVNNIAELIESMYK